jgi:chloramphenicol 3-O-phosphotransferase
VRTFIFLAGAPGAGKSTVAAILQRRLGTPLFEFGWIPEFRNTGTRVISYTEDESLAFENLTLVLKNYARHGFANILITDLEDKRIEQLGSVFQGFSFMIVALRVLDEDELRRRVMDESRPSGYRDWREAVRINRRLLARPPFPSEHFIDIAAESAAEVADTMLELMCRSQARTASDPTVPRTRGYPRDCKRDKPQRVQRAAFRAPSPWEAADGRA